MSKKADTVRKLHHLTMHNNPLPVTVGNTSVLISVVDGLYCVHHLYTDRSVAEKEYYEYNVLGLQCLVEDLFGEVGE